MSRASLTSTPTYHARAAGLVTTRQKQRFHGEQQEAVLNRESQFGRHTLRLR
jgi:hypothetical protein